MRNKNKQNVKENNQNMTLNGYKTMEMITIIHRTTKMQKKAT